MTEGEIHTRRVARFWSRVNKRSVCKCWNWRHRISKGGYGNFHSPGGQLAHRFSMELLLGHKLKPGEFVLHDCDNRKCVNPFHLFLGNNNDNVQDAVQKGRHQKGERSGRAKLNARIIRQIRKLASIHSTAYVHRWVLNSVGIKIGRSPIVDVIKRNTWKHIL